MIIGGYDPYFQQTQWTPLNTVDGVPVPQGYVPPAQPQLLPQAGLGTTTVVGGGFASGFEPPTVFNPTISQPQNQFSVWPSALTGNHVLYAHYAPNGTATTPATQPAANPAAAANPAPAAQPAPTAATSPAAGTGPAAEKPAAEKKPEPRRVTVKSGDSLSKLAAASGTTWQKLYELNKGVVGGDPNLIRPGQRLKLA